MGLDALEDEHRRVRSNGVVMPTPMSSLASEDKPKFYTADGIPIEPVGEADRQPLPGDDLPPILKKVIEKSEATKPKPKPPVGEVTLFDVRWGVAPGVRALEIGYRFHNGVPQPRLYVLMARINDGDVQTIPLDDVESAEGVLTLSLPAMLLDGGRLPKVEVWIERNLGARVMQKVSNSAVAD